MPERRQCHQLSGTLTLVPKLVISPHQGIPPAPGWKADQCSFRLSGKWQRAPSLLGLSAGIADVCVRRHWGHAQCGCVQSSQPQSSEGCPLMPTPYRGGLWRSGLSKLPNQQGGDSEFKTKSDARQESVPLPRPPCHGQECCREPRRWRAGCPSGIFHPSHSHEAL